MQEVNSPALILETNYLTASDAAGIYVSQVTNPQDYEDAAYIFNSIWGGKSGTYVSEDYLRALVLTGGYLVIARDSKNHNPVAASFAFWGIEEGHKFMHSDSLGVIESYRRSGVGYAVKLHQAAFALEQQASRVQWTFDPTLRKNAFFNLVKLGCGIEKHLPNFYKPTNTDTGDRLLVSLNLYTLPKAITEGTPHTTDSLLSAKGSNKYLSIPTPENIESSRLLEPAKALITQINLNKALATAFEDGNRFIGFSQKGEYIFTK